MENAAEGNTNVINAILRECEKCDYIANYEWNLKLHTKAVHEKIKDQKCHNCDYATNHIEVK
jgi:hypothetical protein